MKALLKTSAIHATRPYATYYYAAVRDSAKDWSRIGHAGSVYGAARAAVGHLVMRKYASCVIHDERNIVIARIFREGRKIIHIGI